MIFNMLLAAGLACTDLPGMTENFDSETIDRDALTTLVESNSNCARALVVQGRLQMKADDIEAGVDTFRRLVTEHDSESMAHTWLGRALLTLASRESSLSAAKEAVQSLETAIELDPMNFEAREALASFHRNAPWIAGGDMDVAEEQAEFVAQHDARRGLEMRISNLMADGDEDDAIELMKDALAKHPGWEEMALQLAIAYHGEDDYSNAFDVLSAHAAKDDPNPMVVYQLGRTAALSGEFIEPGRAAMQRYIVMAEKDTSLGIPASSGYWRLGNIEEHAGDIAAARKAYEMALELDPENEQARDALDDLD